MSDVAKYRHFLVANQSKNRSNIFFYLLFCSIIEREMAVIFIVYQITSFLWSATHIKPKLDCLGAQIKFQIITNRKNVGNRYSSHRSFCNLLIFHFDRLNTYYFDFSPYLKLGAFSNSGDNKRISVHVSIRYTQHPSAIIAHSTQRLRSTKKCLCERYPPPSSSSSL